MTNLDLDRCLTMAAYSAFVTIREYLDKNPGIPLFEVVDTICSINSDAAGFDYLGGTSIHNNLGFELVLSDDNRGLRTVVFELVRIAQPWWLRLVPYGRDRVRSVLGRDQQQCLREAGLFDPIPNADVVAWWDELASIFRGTSDAERMITARKAERLSIEYECNRLKKIGISLKPEWVSLEDNSLGYDIRSYDLVKEHVVNRLIEVKSTISRDIFVTKNEWHNALSAEQQYCFHVWKLPEEKMTEYPVSAMKPNIPINQGTGTWQDVSITLI